MRVRSLYSKSLQKPSPVDASPRVVVPPEAMSEGDAARYIGMSGGWLKKARTRRFRTIKNGPPFVRAGARRVVYRRRDLDAWLADHVEHARPI